MKLILISLSLLSFSCSSPNYFKDTAIGKDELLNEWFTIHLKSFNEKSIQNKESLYLRVMILPTFDHPWFFSIFEKDGQMKCKIAQTDGKGGYKSGEIIFTKTYTLSDKDKIKFQKLLNFDILKIAPTDPGELLGMDGTYYVIEYCNNNNYNVFTRSSLEYVYDQKTKDLFPKLKDYFKERKKIAEFILELKKDVLKRNIIKKY